MTLVISIDDAVVATLSGSRFHDDISVVGTGSFEQGISGSLTRLVDGRSYLAAGTNTTVSSQSNGQVTISSRVAPVNASYVCVSADGTLTNERILSGTSGITIYDSGANSQIEVLLDETYLDTQFRRMLVGYKAGATFIGTNTDYFGIYHASLGTITAPGTQTSSNMCSRTFGVDYTTAVTANSRNGIYSLDSVQRQAAYGLDGWYSVHTFAFDTLLTSITAKCFFGMKVLTTQSLDSTFSTNQPSGIRDGVGVGLDSGDTQLQIMHNDGFLACTKVPTGITATNGTAYCLKLQCNKGGTSIAWTLNDLNLGTQAQGVLTSNLPSISGALSYEHTGGNGSDGGVYTWRNIGNWFSANPEDLGQTQF